MPKHAAKREPRTPHPLWMAAVKGAVQASITWLLANVHHILGG